MNAAVTQNLERWRTRADAQWTAMAPRERIGAAVALGLVLFALLWAVALGPALRTVRGAPAQLDRLDAQLADMQRLAAEARSLKDSTPVAPAQAQAALRGATDRLGPAAKLLLAGDRATLTLTGVTGDRLRQWLAEARSGARARPVEAQLTRSGEGFSGTLVVAIGGGS